jgi:pantothenate synthetase
MLPSDEELRGDEPLVALAAARLGMPRLLDNIEI